MDSIYTDTSCLVAYYINEQFSAFVQEIFSDNEIFISPLTEVEFQSFLNKAVRMGELTSDQKKKVISLFQDHLREGLFREVAASPAVFKLAIWSMENSSYPLRTLDSIQLGISMNENLKLLTTDRVMYHAATELKLDLVVIDSFRS